MIIYGLIFGVISLIFMTWYNLALPFIIIGKLDCITALRMSRKLCSKQFWWFLLYGVTIAIFENIGGSFIYIGLFLTIPINSILKYSAYDQIVGSGDKNEEAQLVS